MTDAALFQPVRLRSLTVPNRVWVSPMCQYSADARDGMPTDWHLVHLGALAQGGAGLVMTEATAVSPEGRISAWDLGIWNDEQRDALARIVDFVHARGAVAAVQLAHAGRKASTLPEWRGHGSQSLEDGGWTTVAPSAVPFAGYAAPVALDEAGIAGVVADFAAGARRAVGAGFDAIELHAAHGYLIHQFLSPLANHRTDAWGGSLERRARLLLDVVRAVRDAIGEDVPLLVRFSGTDWVDGGWTIEDTDTVAGWAAEAGADWFDVSSGGVVGDAKIPVGPGYQVPLATAVRTATGMPVNAVGLIHDAEQAEAIVAEGRADAVMLARPLLRNPHLPQAWAAELGVDVAWPVQYRRAKPRHAAVRA
ncbi:NADH:flavin oxidoreductase/NADH oxidase [Amnibacterium kyonggiense]|uniref:NADH:flavin oxidoreductase/NADH oxidase n=1 Tax=Amnibacterium kyonggiense TaxID=595671 RepID=UPI00147730B9|nr:NADH:flavin oxidoreductase/NADH oxidase [Amnibacterium kyonggiense]